MAIILMEIDFKCIFLNETFEYQIDFHGYMILGMSK